MKKLDIVKLIDDSGYGKFNLKNNMHGIVINVFKNENADVLFFNPQNDGDYAVIPINVKDLVIEKETLPKNIQDEWQSKMGVILSKAKSIIEPIEINEYDMVELLVEDNKYAKYGVHKGCTGCVMDNHAVENYIEVDFSGIDDDGNFFGDCISVNIKDLKVLERNKS